jgi:hypothetical protein
MGIGAAVGLFAAGAILYWAVEFDLPYIDDNALGAIGMVVGLLIAAVIVVPGARRPHGGPSAGAGIGLVAAGAILVWAVAVDFPLIIDDALGVILMIGGTIALLAALTMQWQATRKEQRRHDTYV